MTCGGNKARHKSNRHDDETLVGFSAMENFVRLQESQEEWLKWLEASEKKNPDMDRYAYKKVR